MATGLRLAQSLRETSSFAALRDDEYRRMAVHKIFPIGKQPVGTHEISNCFYSSIVLCFNNGKGKSVSIHIACAIEAECDFFITTDDDLCHKYTAKEIIICNPVDFIKVLEEYDE